MWFLRLVISPLTFFFIYYCSPVNHLTTFHFALCLYRVIKLQEPYVAVGYYAVLLVTQIMLSLYHLY